ncbi:hypothetical protein MUK42_02083 [Musa troglodytarum]|uniref:Gag1-like clamp domain-containing protein n=2 Tax=Musa troglodytarum TaxID=320322 RepID=A0A9E7FVH1_9LILI|nr:hypothetical protein MUK42_02083 [Musa troglodytarum]
MENNVSNSLSLVTNVSSCPTTVNDETKSMEENANNVSFVNQGAIAWSEMRREWVGDRSKRPHRAPREPTIRQSMDFELILSGVLQEGKEVETIPVCGDGQEQAHQQHLQHKNLHFMRGECDQPNRCVGRHALANERSKSRNRFFRRLIEGVRDEDPRPRIDALSDGFPLAISCSPRWFLMAEGEKGEFVKLDLVECSKDEAMACDGRMWQNTDWKKPDHFLEVVLHVAVPSLHVPRGRASAGVAEIGSCSNFPVVLDGGRRRTSRRGQLVAVKTTRPWCDVSVWLLKKRGRGIPDSTEETSNHWEPCWLHALSLSE